MAGEKKKVNLVDLKAKFGKFLHNYYSCQNCYSIDKLAFGFDCEHKFCINCNLNQTDNCKECKTKIDNLQDDKLQTALFKEFEILKNVMNVDLKKVSNKLKSNKEPVKELNKELVKESSKEPVKELNKELVKESSEEPVKETNKEQVKELNKEPVKEPKHTPTKRESSRTNKSKALSDLIKEATSEKKAEEHAVVKSATKSARKTLEKSTKPNSATKQSSSIVIIATSITDSELKLLEKFAKKFHAKVANEFSDKVTHLVTLETKPNSRLTTRTLKYLKSLLTHKWLLDFKWVKDSLEKNELVDESDYELIGITKQNELTLGAPKRSRENLTVKLFEGKKFYIDGKFKGGLPKTDYRDLVKVGGGEVIEDEKDVQDDTYIIIEATYSKSKFKGREKSLSTTDFLNCISDFKFDL